MRSRTQSGLDVSTHSIVKSSGCFRFYVTSR